MDHIRRGTLDLSTVVRSCSTRRTRCWIWASWRTSSFILDQVPQERQIALFSATVPRRIEALAKQYQRDPERITIGEEARTAPQTRQFFVGTPQRAKVEALTSILDLKSPASAIVSAGRSAT